MDKELSQTVDATCKGAIVEDKVKQSMAYSMILRLLFAMKYILNDHNITFQLDGTAEGVFTC